MAILKCKMCGGDITANVEQSYGTCDSCGTTSTLPKVNDEQRANLFNRANHFRRQNEFDKALSAYESILNLDNSDAEAHWGIVLSRYGIEYVDDPITGNKVPTCHRVQPQSILADVDYLSALENCVDGYTRGLYESEANAIALIQKKILDISSREQPYDVFLCYKETNAMNTRTKDSVMAQDIYYQLVKEGYRVFFSRISLEDKLGQEYEPYIFAALNSAKVMLAVGTSSEHFNAPWVKNEWKRYLSLMKNDSEKLLVPCYIDMDAYDLPEELSMLQSQDMSKIGFIQDLIRGIKKVLDAESATNSTAVETTSTGSTVASLLRRAELFLEDSDFKSADEYCDKILDIDPECGAAYLFKLCSEFHCCRIQEISISKIELATSNNYNKAVRFAGKQEKYILDEYNNCRQQQFEEQLNLLDRWINLPYQNRTLPQVMKRIFLIGAVAKKIKDIAENYYLLNNKIDSSKTNLRILNEQKTKLGIFKSREKKEVDTQILRYTNEFNTGMTLLNETLKGLEHAKKLIADSLLTDCEPLEITKRLHNQLEKEEGYICILKERQKLLKKLSNRLDKRLLLHNEDKLIKLMNTYMDDTDKQMNMLIFLRTSPILGHLEQLLPFSETAFDSMEDLYSDIKDISTYEYHTVGLMTNGTVVATGSNCNGNITAPRKGDGQMDVENWNNIIAISAGRYHTVGLKADGTVIATGDFVYRQTQVQDLFETLADRNPTISRYRHSWSDMIAVAAGEYHTVGLKADGTVVATGKNDSGQIDIEHWSDIVAIAAGNSHTVGIKSDGTAVAVGENKDGKTNIGNWTDIIAISAGENHTLGLKVDGTVVVAGKILFGQTSVENWHNIIAISSCGDHVMGLKADGTVVNCGGHCDVKSWSNIIAISAGKFQAVGLKADGTVVGNGSRGMESLK